MSIGDLLAIEVIAVVGVLLLIGTIIPGVRLYWPKHDDPVSRSDLGVALMGGALIAFAVLGLQLMIQFRSEKDARERQQQADRAALLLVLGQSPNLSGLDLHEEDLAEAYLNGKTLRGADLTGADLTKARVQDTDLVAADLRSAELDEARLDRADLRYADLQGASLRGAQLSGVNLDAASLVEVDLSGADLSNASVRADLTGANLRSANLVGTSLAPANLERADLRGADFEFADLRGANLSGAKLRGTPGTGVRDAKNLDVAKDLSLVKYDHSTEWPDSFKWNFLRPRCKEPPPCTLGKRVQPVSDFPLQLKEMRADLTQAIKNHRCLPGWRVGETPVNIVAHAPRDGVTFQIQTWVDAGTNAKVWADDMGYELRHENVQPLGSISADGASSAYAERIGRPAEVAVYLILEPPLGVRMWGTAPPRSLDLYQRDFLKLFRVLGVKGDLFPSLRGDKAGCPV